MATFNHLLSLLPTGDKAPALGIAAHTQRGNGMFQPVEDFNRDEFNQPAEKRRVILPEPIKAVFAPTGEGSGYQVLTRNEAKARLQEITGCGESACYAALASDGKFAARLKKQGHSLTLR